MTYYLQNSELDHLTSLETALQGWTIGPQDIYLVSREGERVYSQQALLSLYSPLLAGILCEAKDECPGVSLDASSVTIASLVDLLAHGKASCDNKDDLKNVHPLAASLGIKIPNSVMEQVPKNMKGPGPVSVRMVVPKSEVVAARIDAANSSLEKSISTKKENFYKNAKSATFNSITVTRTLVPVVKKENVEEDNTIVPESTPTIDRVTCGSCYKAFKHQTGLRKHLDKGRCKGMVGDTPKLFKCDKCGKAFGLKTSLKTHEILHMKELPYKCDDCEKTFAQANNLRVHAKTRHDTELGVIKKRNGLEDGSNEGSTDRLNGAVEDNVSDGGFVNIDQTENYEEQVTDSGQQSDFIQEEEMEEDDTEENFNEEAAYPAVSLFCDTFENIVHPE